MWAEKHLYVEVKVRTRCLCVLHSDFSFGVNSSVSVQVSDDKDNESQSVFLTCFQRNLSSWLICQVVTTCMMDRTAPLSTAALILTGSRV